MSNTITFMNKKSIPIILNGKESMVDFVQVSSVKFKIVVSGIMTSQTIGFDDTDEIVDNNINEAVLIALGDYEWYRL